MPIDILTLKQSGYNKQVTKFNDALHQIGQNKRIQEARAWIGIGATVNDCFYEMKYVYTINDAICALAKLGIDYTKCKGRKWFQFWLSDMDVKIENAIKGIPIK